MHLHLYCKHTHTHTTRTELLNNMFNVVYDVDVVSEQVFCGWRDKGTETFGKRNSEISVKTFFDWLDCAETESDGEGGEGEERGDGIKTR